MTRIRQTSALLAIAFLALAVVAPVLSADDDAIYDKVRERLYNDPDIKAHNLTITVKNGVVTLEGRVTSDKLRSKAEKITRKVSGVKNVINNLKVGEEKPS